MSEAAEIVHICKPYDTPAALILDNITMYNKLKGSLNPQDVTQCIKLARNIMQKAEELISEAYDRRDDLIEQLKKDT